MNRTERAELAEKLDVSDGDIADAADLIASQVHEGVAWLRKVGGADTGVHSFLGKTARKHYVALPDNRQLFELINRLTSPAWWRRQLHKRFRKVEQQERLRGAVHCKASPYVSAKALRRADRHRRRLAEMLATLEVVNQNTGETLPLEDVISKSRANPANRRKALGAQMKGVEKDANGRGLEAHFLTITAPSRMHARHKPSGAKVENSDGSDPRKVQAYLCKVWKNANRKLKHLGLKRCGLRIVEPHHDGCPHWHVLIFTQPAESAVVLAVIRDHAFADSPNEQGAAEHRFKVERIDPDKGSPIGYVMKYLSKNIDGEGVDNDEETGGTGSDGARAAGVWARLWGIRQFQFFGLPPITPYRELYRNDGHGLGSPGVVEVHQACKANNYAEFLKRCREHAVGFVLRRDPRPSTRYPNEMTTAIVGLHISAADLHTPVDLTTRSDFWVIQPRPAKRVEPAFALPWTRFNNCAPTDKSMGYVLPEKQATSTSEQASRAGLQRQQATPAASPPRGKRHPEKTEIATC